MGKYFSFGQNTTLTGNLLINNYYVVVIACSTWLWNMELMKLNWKQVKLSFSMECRGWNNVRNAWGSEQIPSPKIEFPILNTISFSVRVRKFFAAAVFIVTNTVPSIFFIYSKAFLWLGVVDSFSPIIQCRRFQHKRLTFLMSL